MRSVNKGILVSIRLSAVFMLLCSAQAVGQQRKVRVVHFPQDRSIGTLELQDASRRLEGVRETHVEAKGKVVVPENRRLSLVPNQSGIKDLSPLSKLGPNDLYELTFPWPRSGDVVPDDMCMPHLAGLTGLEYLDLQPTYITAKGLRFIRNFKSLQYLKLPAKTTDAGLAQIAGLQSLKELNCPKAFISSKGFTHLAKLASLEILTLDLEHNCDAGFVHLAKLPSLKSLEVSSKFSDAGLEHVSQLSGLVNLDLSDTNVSDKGLIHLAGMHSLKRLELGKTRRERRQDPHGPRVTGAGMRHLAQIQSLEELDLHEGVTDTGLAYLANLSKLKRLDCGGGDVSDAGLQHLAKLQFLEELNVKGDGITDQGMKYLVKLSNLQKLSLSTAQLTDKGMYSIAKLRNLRTLSLRAEKVTGDGVAELAQLKSLEQLAVDTERATISTISKLNSLSNLTYLDVDNVVQDNSILNISGLAKLVKLTLRGDDEWRDEDLACLANLKDLKYLQGISGFGDAGMAHLKNLVNMERLWIGETSATDKGLSYLSNMKKLDFLGISGNFTDAGLRHLEGRKALGNLRIFSENDFSPGAVERLRTKSPNLQDFNCRKAWRVKRRPKIGEDAYAFKLTTLDGKQIKLEDYRGKCVLLYFWATWCRPCIASTPNLKEFYKDLSQYGDFEMISISLDDGEYKTRQHINQHKITWPQVCVGLGSRVAAEYGVSRQVPAYILIGPDGKILLSHELNKRKIKAAVVHALRE